MTGADGRPYREGGVWIRRLSPGPREPKRIDRRPDTIPIAPVKSPESWNVLLMRLRMLQTKHVRKGGANGTSRSNKA